MALRVIANLATKRLPFDQLLDHDLERVETRCRDFSPSRTSGSRLPTVNIIRLRMMPAADFKDQNFEAEAHDAIFSHSEIRI